MEVHEIKREKYASEEEYHKVVLKVLDYKLNNELDRFFEKAAKECDIDVKSLISKYKFNVYKEIKSIKDEL